MLGFRPFKKKKKSDFPLIIQTREMHWKKNKVC